MFLLLFYFSITVRAYINTFILTILRFIRPTMREEKLNEYNILVYYFFVAFNIVIKV